MIADYAFTMLKRHITNDDRRPISYFSFLYYCGCHGTYVFRKHMRNLTKEEKKMTI